MWASTRRKKSCAYFDMCTPVPLVIYPNCCLARLSDVDIISCYLRVAKVDEKKYRTVRCWAQLVWHTCKADRGSIAEGASSPFPSATLPHSPFSSMSNSTNGVMMLKVCLPRIVAAIEPLVWGSERRRSADAGTWLTPVYSVTRHSTCRCFLSKKRLLYCQFLHVPFLVDVYCTPRRRPLRRLMYVSHPRH